MADTSKKARKKGATKAVAAKPTPKPTPKPKPTLPELRIAWGEAQAVREDRERGYARANATQNSKQDRADQVAAAEKRLSKARAAENKARDNFVSAQREAQVR